LSATPSSIARIVLDAFAGSGTTLLAAEKTGRRGYGIELDLHYADLIIKRFEETYGLEAIHIDSDLSINRVKAERTERSKNGQAGTINRSWKKAEWQRAFQQKATNKIASN
jgi:adenine specific DNA methylase Mod